MTTLLRIGLSLILATLIGWVAWRRGSLSTSGWVGAILVGTLTAGFGGWAWGGLVVVFFVSSSLLSRFGDRYKEHDAAQYWEKGAQRDLGQVLANGGPVALLAIVWWLFQPVPLVWIAAIGIMATVTGDTWATEIGVLSRTQPRLITTWRIVPPGTSGGISLLGTGAAIGGAMAICVSAWLFGLMDQTLALPAIGWFALVGGITGVASDSFLGATVQAMRWCPQCNVETERRLHSCGKMTEPLRGIAWLRNDAVNILSSLVGGMVAALLASI